MSKGAAKRVLMVDDDHEDIFVIRRALAKSDLKLEFSAVDGGEELFTYLERKDNKQPDFLLLDINMPGANGYDVLKKLRESKEWKSLPVFMLSTSVLPAEVKKAKSLGANAFFGKPSSKIESDELIGLLKPELEGQGIII